MDSRHALCLTTVDAALADSDPAKVATAGKLADAFLDPPDAGYAAASVASGGASLTLYSQLANNSVEDYSSPGGAVVTANASPAFAGTATKPAPGKGFNDGLAIQSVPAPGGLTLTGFYIDHSAKGRFLVGASDSSGANRWATLAATSGTWALGPFSDLSAGLPAGFGLQASGCVGAAAHAVTATDVGVFPGGTYSVATGINASGQVVGGANTSPTATPMASHGPRAAASSIFLRYGATHAVLWH